MKPKIRILISAVGIILITYSGFSKRESIESWIRGIEYDLAFLILGFLLLISCLVKTSPADSDRKDIKIISLPWFILGLLLVAASTWIATSWLLAEADDGQRIDAIRTGLTIGAGTGGAMALIISARRQWLGERSHLHDMSVSQENLKDAQERRITELQANASDQISSDSAAARLSGLYTLERLAQNNPEYRQTITNILCAYLRMPFKSANNIEDINQTSETPPANRQEEKEVRLTAQEILVTHLRQDPATGSTYFWSDISLDLSRATLIDFNFDDCQVKNFICKSADIQGSSSFRRSMFETSDFSHTTFRETAQFSQSEFSRSAIFEFSDFQNGCHFESAKLAERTSFARSTFSAPADFTSSTFRGPVSFSVSKLHTGAQFYQCHFEQSADFSSILMRHLSVFQECIFNGDTTFASASFPGGADFESAKFLKVSSFKGAAFGYDALFENVEFFEYASLKNMKVEFFGNFKGSRFNRVSFSGSRFGCTANFSSAHFNGDFNLSVIKCDWAPMLDGATVTSSDGQFWPDEWEVIWDKEDLGHFKKRPELVSDVVDDEG